MKIAVTGSRGQLGLTLGRISSEYPRHEFIFADRQEADITDPAALLRFLERTQAEAVINCAAYTAVEQAENDREAASRINAAGPALLARMARQKGIPLIHFSTDYVFPGNLHRPLREEDPTGPLNVYGLTKLTGERAVLESGCRGAVLRTSWLYSEFGRNFVLTMLRLGREGVSPRVVCDQIGSPTYAADLARAAVELLMQGTPGMELYHYSDEGSLSWYDFAQEIFSRAKLSVRAQAIASADYPSTVARPPYSVLSKEKIAGRGIPVPCWTESLQCCLDRIARLHAYAPGQRPSCRI